MQMFLALREAGFGSSDAVAVVEETSDVTRLLTAKASWLK